MTTLSVKLVRIVRIVEWVSGKNFPRPGRDSGRDSGMNCAGAAEHRPAPAQFVPKTG